MNIDATRGVTDHGDDEHDEEGVEHGDDGGGQGGEDALEGAEAAEEAEHAERAEDADGEVERAQGDERERDDNGIEAAPAVIKKLAQPVGVEVDEELDSEYYGEAGVDQVEEALDADSCYCRIEGGLKLGLTDGCDEILFC